MGKQLYFIFGENIDALLIFGESAAGFMGGLVQAAQYTIKSFSQQ